MNLRDITGFPTVRWQRIYRASSARGAAAGHYPRAAAAEGNRPSPGYGSPDDLKLYSCMTLFEAVVPEHPEFAAVLEKFYARNRDKLTLQLLAEKEMDG